MPSPINHANVTVAVNATPPVFLTLVDPRNSPGDSPAPEFQSQLASPYFPSGFEGGVGLGVVGADVAVGVDAVPGAEVGDVVTMGEDALAAVFVLPDAPAAPPMSKPTRNVVAAIATSFLVLWPFKGDVGGLAPGGGGGTALIE